MEISLDFTRAWRGILALGLVLALALIGRAVTPTLDAETALLTADLWHATALARRVGAEIVRLDSDARTLRGLAAQDAPDAIQAMLLAQRIYAAHDRGTAATAPARQALIAAAEATARFASGGASRESAVDAVNAALARIQALGGGADDDYKSLADGDEPGPVRPGATPTD